MPLIPWFLTRTLSPIARASAKSKDDVGNATYGPAFISVAPTPALPLKYDAPKPTLVAASTAW